MGLFSWKTGDTEKSIAVKGSSRDTFKVKMLSPDGREWIEENYQGYGVFGGKDIYELIAELNTENPTRYKGVHICYEADPKGDFEEVAKKGFKMPKLVESDSISWEEAPYPTNCPDQGYFY